MVYPAMLILVTPFRSYCLHESRVFAELQKLEHNQGNFLVFKYKANLLSKFFFSRAVYSLLLWVAAYTQAYNSFNFSFNSSFQPLTSSSFSSAFTLQESSTPLNLAFRASTFSCISAFYLLKFQVSSVNSFILPLISSSDFQRLDSIQALFLDQSSILSATVFLILTIVLLISSIPPSNLPLSSTKFKDSLLNRSF